MTERETLEFAAKAAGLEGYEWNDDFRCMVIDDGEFMHFFEPNNDNGAALELAVVLHINLEFNNGTVTAIWFDLDRSETHEVQEVCDEAFEGMEAKKSRHSPRYRPRCR